MCIEHHLHTLYIKPWVASSEEACFGNSDLAATPTQLAGVFTDRLTLLHSERPKLHTILAFLSVIGLNNLYILGNQCH